MNELNTNFEIKKLFEDDNVIVVDKPEGLASIHDKEGTEPDLYSLLCKRTNKKLFVVHRLDKEVSGIIIYAKNSSTHKHLNKQFNERTVEKYYIALVHGVIEKESGIINKPIREFGSGRMGVDDKKGKPSKTIYKVLERFSNHTLVELNPSTGRRHQLRVHLYYVGYPIVGDVRYGERKTQEKFPRLMLHAKNISFKVNDDKNISISSELPISFTNVLKNIL